MIYQWLALIYKERVMLILLDFVLVKIVATFRCKISVMSACDMRRNEAPSDVDKTLDGGARPR